MTSKPSMPGIWMSRKTTSGLQLSSAANVSAPSPHSAATLNAGKSASRWRTPRRAAGSSSAISTRHSFIGKFGLPGKLPIRHTQGCHGAVRARAQLERGRRAVQGAQTFARIGQTVTVGSLGPVGHASPIIGHGHDQLIAIASAFYAQPARSRPLRYPVPDRILGQMLNGKPGHGGMARLWRDVEVRLQPIRKARLLDGQVLLHQLELLFERDF